MVHKELHLKRLRTEFPLPQSTKVRNIQKTDVQKFLAQCNHLTSTSWNAALTVTRDVFKHAVEDGIIAHSTAADVVYRPRKDKNKRHIPSFAEFQSIVETVRECFVSVLEAKVLGEAYRRDYTCRRPTKP